MKKPRCPLWMYLFMLPVALPIVFAFVYPFVLVLAKLNGYDGNPADFEAVVFSAFVFLLPNYIHPLM